jgi:hypothetical protein
VVVEYLIPLETSETMGVGVAVEFPLPWKEGKAGEVVEYPNPLREVVAVAVVNGLGVAVVNGLEVVVADHRLEAEEENPIDVDDLWEDLLAA